MDSAVDRIKGKAADTAFGRPLVTNVLRGLVVEAIIADALGDDWTWCAADYASWDFERSDGIRLEVKQSAARQSWATAQPSVSSFDIAPRKGRWETGKWVAEPGRAASIYVFAHHPLVGNEADHRDPAQWVFHPVLAANLPATKRLSLTATRRLTPPVAHRDLARRVKALADVCA